MATFAQIGMFNGDLAPVLRVIVAEQDFIDSGAVGDPKTWIQTSYNTFAGEHKLGGEPLRKNYAGVGYTYSKSRDGFIMPKPEKFASFILNENTCQYTYPVAKPTPTNNEKYIWDEASVSWKTETK